MTVQITRGRWAAGVACATAALLLASLALAAVSEAAKRHGVQRHYVGARWAYSPKSLGWYATLRLDRAVTRDYRRGGFIAQTLWLATNEGKTAYGRNRRTPYLQVSVSRGFRGRNITTLAVAQRNQKGKYYEGRQKGPVEFGKDYRFSVVNTGGGHWDIKLGAAPFADAKGAGRRYGSMSAFAGLESTSAGNRARGAVTDLSWLVQSGHGAGVFPRWQVGDQERGASKLVRRGGRASARWTSKHYSLRNSYGR